MRVVITIEDTERGVRCEARAACSGVNDAPARSVAVHLGAILDAHVERLFRLHVVNIEPNPEEENAFGTTRR